MEMQESEDQAMIAGILTLMTFILKLTFMLCLLSTGLGAITVAVGIALVVCSLYTAVVSAKKIRASSRN